MERGLLLQDLHARFVHLDDVVAELHLVHQIDQWHDEIAHSDHPTGHRCATKMGTDAGKDFLKPVERQAVAEFCDDDVGEQGR